MTCYRCKHQLAVTSNFTITYGFFFLSKLCANCAQGFKNHDLGFLCFFINPTFCLFGLVGFLVFWLFFSCRSLLLAFHSSHSLVFWLSSAFSCLNCCASSSCTAIILSLSDDMYLELSDDFGASNYFV